MIELHESFGLPLFGSEKREDVLVPKFRGMAVIRQMVGVDSLGAVEAVAAGVRGMGAIEKPRVPVALTGNRLGTPVGPNAKFSVPKPFWTFVFPK